MISLLRTVSLIKLSLQVNVGDIVKKSLQSKKKKFMSKKKKKILIPKKSGPINVGHS